VTASDTDDLGEIGGLNREMVDRSERSIDGVANLEKEWLRKIDVL
jgi:hypothetical protein